MPLDQVQLLNYDPVFRVQYPLDLTAFTFIFPADDHYFVIFFKPHHCKTPNYIFAVSGFR
jgi:hypothetical protein